MIEILSRAAQLFALVIAPRWPSPEPAGPETGMALLAVALLSITPALSFWLVRRFEVFEAKVALGLALFADLVVLYEAHATLAGRRPLLSGFYAAAPFVWAALAAIAATFAGQYLGGSFKNKRTAAAVAVLAVGIFVLRDAHGYIASDKDQWVEAWSRDSTHERALFALADDIADPHRDWRKQLDACIARAPASCACRTLRAERRVGAAAADENALLAEIDQGACEGHAMQKRSLDVRALGLALARRYDEAEVIARPRLAESPFDPRVLYTMALVESARGGPDALELARKAAANGAGRRSELLVTQLLIRSGDTKAARSALAAFLRAHPNDYEGVYNLALVADLEGDFNAAREGYLSVVKLRPSFADARYNLALLTLKFGAKSEAQFHARKFAETWPDDPRAADLQGRVNAAP